MKRYRRSAADVPAAIASRTREQGQAIVVFALMLVVMLGAGGLAVDVGSAWGQRRTQQNVADAAALAAATAEANNASRADIVAAAISSAASNGFSASEITVNIPPKSGAYATTTNDCSTAAARPCWIEVVVNRDHRNSFASALGQSTWNVAARAVAVGGIANTVVNGIAPLQFNFASVQSNQAGVDQGYCSPQNVSCPPNDPHATWPMSTAKNPQFAWTQFCVGPANCNVNAATAMGIINGGNYQTPVYLGMYLGPHNGGGMDSVCIALKTLYPNGADIPVAISDDNGTLVGFWVWHFDAVKTDCTGGMDLWGYFVQDITSWLPLSIAPTAPPATFGAYVVRLVE